MPRDIGRRQLFFGVVGALFASAMAKLTPMSRSKYMCAVCMTTYLRWPGAFCACGAFSTNLVALNKRPALVTLDEVLGRVRGAGHVFSAGPGEGKSRLLLQVLGISDPTEVQVTQVRQLLDDARRRGAHVWWVT